MAAMDDDGGDCVAAAAAAEAEAAGVDAVDAASPRETLLETKTEITENLPVTQPRKEISNE